MKISLAAPALCLWLLAAGTLWAQKPASDRPKTDHSASSSKASSPAPTHAEPAPPPHPDPGRPTAPDRREMPKSGQAKAPAPPIVDPNSLPKVPRAYPVKPEKADQSKNVTLKKVARAGKVEPAKTVALSHPPQAIMRQFPMVLWPSPMTIRQGQPLADALKGASADVMGTFTYLPDLTYVPPQGQCAVSIHFDPADTVHYFSASATVWVTVL